MYLKITWLEYDIASDILGLRESIQLTELKNFTIALSVFIVVDIITFEILRFQIS